MQRSTPAERKRIHTASERLGYANPRRTTSAKGQSGNSETISPQWEQPKKRRPTGYTQRVPIIRDDQLQGAATGAPVAQPVREKPKTSGQSVQKPTPAAKVRTQQPGTVAQKEMPKAQGRPVNPRTAPAQAAAKKAPTAQPTAAPRGAAAQPKARVTPGKQAAQEATTTISSQEISRRVQAKRPSVGANNQAPTRSINTQEVEQAMRASRKAQAVHPPASRTPNSKSTPSQRAAGSQQRGAAKPQNGQRPASVQAQSAQARPTARPPVSGQGQAQSVVRGPRQASTQPVAKPQAVRPNEQKRKENAETQIRKQGEKFQKTKSSAAHKKKQRLVVLGVLLGLILLGVGLFFGSQFYYSKMLEPVGGSSESQIVEIPKGSTVKEVGEILKENGLIRNAMIFQSYAGRHSRGEKTMQAGVYEFNAEMSAPEIFTKMMNGETYTGDYPVVIPEGRNIEEMAEILEERGIVSSAEFIAETKKLAEYKAKYPEILGGIPDDKDRFLEGYLFPASYELHVNQSASDVVTKMLDRFQEVYDSDLKDQVAASGKTLDEIVIMGSVVELETKLPEDRANAASVFYNRIAADMPLQSDITVDYARGEKTPVLTEEQTQFESPYNTYINKGLPVGPICSPGLASLEAALHPAETKYLYFVADMSSGKLYFNETLEGHEADVQKYMGD